VAAFGLGLTVGWLPSYLVSRLGEATGRGLALGPLMAEAAAAPWQSLPLWVVIVGVAPVCEELVFRGLVWSALDRSVGPVGVIWWSALVFAAYHIDPLQSLAALPMGLVLGGLRWASGSIGPSIVLHVVHNGLSVLLLVLGWGDRVDADTSVALVGPALAAAWAGWRFAR
jgi:membrane protease YdiL (CAAX protease family)